eukprot:jgi/Tetstr1/447162/TSEL_034599.t1
MPVIPVPAMSNATFFDGTPLAPNDVCVPMILVVDGNGKIASYRGNTVTMQDVRDPEVAGFEVAQAPATYTFAPSAGTVSDDASGTIAVYHVVSTALETAASLSNIVTAFGEGFGVASVAAYAANSSVSLSALSGLGTSNVHDSGAGSFRPVAEGDSVYSHILVEDPNGRMAAVSQFVDHVQDYTPPAGLDGVGIGMVTSTSVQVTGLSGITDGGGLATVTVHHNISDTLTGATSAAIAVTGGAVASDAFTLSSLDDATPYYLWVSAEDAAGNAAAAVRIGSAETPDATDPTISGFDVSQGAGTENYTFSATAGTVADNVDGYVDAFLVLSPSASLGAGDIQAIAGADGANLQTGEKALDHAYTSAPGTFDITALSLSTDRYSNGFGFGFTAITQASPDLYAYILVVDAAGNASSAISAGGAKAVVDRTPPTYSGTLTASASGSDAITVSGLDGWSDAGGSGIGGVTAYCGTTAPFGNSASDTAAWVALGTTLSASVASVGDASVAVTGLEADTPYYVRATAVDAAGNVSAVVATADATVSTDAAVSTSHTDGFDAEHTVSVPQTLPPSQSVDLDYTTTLSVSGATLRVRAYAVDTSDLNFYLQFRHVPTGKETRLQANVSSGGNANTMYVKRQVGSTESDLVAPAYYGSVEAQAHTYILRFDNGAGVLIGQVWDASGTEVFDSREAFASSVTDTHAAGDDWIVQFRVEGVGAEAALTEYAYYPQYIPDEYLGADGSVLTPFMGFDPLTQTLYDSTDPATQTILTVPHSLSSGNPIFVETVPTADGLTPDFVIRAFVTGADFSASDRLTLVAYDADNPGTILGGGRIVAGAEALSGLNCAVDRIEVLTTPRGPDVLQQTNVMWMDTVYSPIQADGTGGNNAMYTAQFQNNDGSRVEKWYERHKFSYPPHTFTQGAAPAGPYLPADHLTGARFGGVDQSLVINNVSRFSSVAMTAFAVFKPAGTPDPGVTRSVLANSSAAGSHFCIRDAHVQLTTSQTSYPAGSIPSPDGWSVVACQVATNAQVAWIDGVKFVNTNDTTSGSDGKFAIGSEGGQSTEFFAGEVGEVILVDRLMTEVELDAVNAYLMAKWATV